MSSPLFTIIIPTHNRAERLSVAVESVLAQECEDWELLIIDDGSTDNTRSVAESFTDQRIRYHYQENRQLNGARNTGVRLATGRYIGFLDDDDLFKPDHLSVLKAGMMTDNFKSDIYRSGELLQGGGKTTLVPNYENGPDILRQYWEKVTGMFGMVFRADLMKANTFDESHLLLDDFLWLNRILIRASLYQVEAYTAIVNLHPEQRSATYVNEELLRQNVERLAEAYNFPGVSERVNYRFYHKQVLHQYMHCCRVLCRGGKNYRAMKIWKEGISYASASDWRNVSRTFVMISTGK
ncbi:glycosyltransferase family 2 protein [Neolewinella agarilytica]|uniref:glycosyltransferase family 2 protein n=1 Tax=Neolewinella agarilytica TaxID=478744 RepID=UPI0023539CBE|nr:glycosyltransferase family A protein [Neolewinella agarilytica]